MVYVGQHLNPKPLTLCTLAYVMSVCGPLFGCALVWKGVVFSLSAGGGLTERGTCNLAHASICLSSLSSPVPFRRFDCCSAVLFLVASRCRIVFAAPWRESQPLRNKVPRTYRLAKTPRPRACPIPT